MPRQCALTGKHVQYGHNVSHSKRATNRRFEPNIQKVTLESAALGRNLSMRVSTRALRTVQKKGGLDAFLLGTYDAKLTPQARKLKSQIRRKLHTSKPS
jgi:large subunit ribosomal protein L28